MKTTVEIPDALLEAARRVATRRGVTLRTLIEEGLRHAVKTDTRRSPFRLRDASVGGSGMDPAFEQADWEKVRDVIYTGRGA
jgi:hypothetical protein